jgi:O-antigen ligase
MLHADATLIAAHDAPTTPRRLEQAGLAAVFGVAAALQFSIAAAQTLLAIAIACWLALVVWRRERVEVPRFFWPLAVLAALTLVSAAFSPQPRVSFADTKQLVLFLIVPLTYRLLRGNRGITLTTVIVSVGAASAVFGIFQYGILHYDHLGLRPRGTLGHWMTYSGLLMLVIGVALARILFGKHDRTWAALVMPALAVAVALTFTRSAWVGACAAAALLLTLKDFRLIAILPIVAAAFFAVAPAAITARFMSIFDRNNPTNRDRVAMLREGEQMVRARPLVGSDRTWSKSCAPVSRSGRGAEDQPSPAQRAGPDRRRTRPAGAGRLDLVRGCRADRSGATLPKGPAPDAGGCRSGSDDRHGHRRHVRVQLR